jgi:hypothetical protein
LICKASHEPYSNECVTNGNRKYDGFCAICFISLFPNDPKSIKARCSKELKVVLHRLNKYPNFIYNKPFYVDLEGGCCETKKN